MNGFSGLVTFIAVAGTDEICGKRMTRSNDIGFEDLRRDLSAQLMFICHFQS